MLAILALLPDWLSAEGLIEVFGDWALWGVVLIIFVECGLLFGVVFPGDSLLFATGMLIAADIINANIWLAVVMLTVAAIVGNLVGYQIGKAIGPRLFTTNSRIFKLEYVTRTETFFERYGNRAIILARFVPIVRTVITALAGVGRMDFRRFMKYTAIGGVIWGAGVTLLGYYAGSVPLIKDNVEIALATIFIVSWIPIVLEAYRMKRGNKN